MGSEMRQRTIQGLQVGDSFRISRTFSREEIDAFGDLTRDYNPVHYHTRWSQAKGFDGLVCHGLLVGSMLCEIGGQVAWLATGMTFKFVRPVYPGVTITCTLTITKIDPSGRADAEAVLTDDDGDPVCLAQLKGYLPMGSERDLLDTLVKEGDRFNPLGG
jgi:acyl dehydratase